MVSEAQKRAKNKYDSTHYTVLGLKIRKDEAATFKELCKKHGTNPNAIFRAALDRFMEDHAPDDTAVGGSELDSNKSK